MSQVMESRACHAEFVRIYEAIAVAGEDESAVRFADRQISQHLHYALGRSDAA